MQRAATFFLLCSFGLLLATQAKAQTPPDSAMTPRSTVTPLHSFIPMSFPQATPGQLELINLEGRFAESVAKGGGKAFATWFADDAVTLNNGQPPVQGLTAIAISANWDPKNYQLSWYAMGAQMGPSNDSGFTWGHYDADTKDKDGKPVTYSGRYITFWKKVNGKWKVALDASAEEPKRIVPLIPDQVPLPPK